MPRKQESPGSILARLLQVEDPLKRELLRRRLEDESRRVLEKGAGLNTKVNVKVG
jgi:hypothetical protein